MFLLPPTFPEAADAFPPVVVFLRLLFKGKVCVFWGSPKGLRGLGRVRKLEWGGCTSAMVKCRPPDDPPGGDVSANSGGGKCVRKVEVTIWQSLRKIRVNGSKHKFDQRTSLFIRVLLITYTMIDYLQNMALVRSCITQRRKEIAISCSW